MKAIHFLFMAVSLCPSAQTSSVRELMAMVQGTPKDPAEPNWDEGLARGQAAALQLLSKPMPAEVTAAEWARMTATARRTLGWTLFQQKRLSEAAPVLESYLAQHQSDAEVSYWLGTIAFRQFELERDTGIKTKRLERCIFHFARASGYDGPGSLVPDKRAILNSFIRKTYELYYDSKGDFTPLLRVSEAASSQALPPPGFAIPVRPK